MDLSNVQSEGLLLVGSVKELRAARYGDAHDKAGQVIPGLWRMVVTSGSGRSWYLDLNEVDRETDEATAIWTALQEHKVAEGDSVALRVAGRASGKYVNYRAVALLAHESALG